MTEERRQENRITVTGTLCITYTEDSIKADVDSKNVSMGGMKFVTTRELGVGHEIEILVELSDGEKMPIDGEVIWVKAINTEEEPWYETGIKFVNMQEKEKKLLEKHIKERK
jgi:Tfp pilus assembly protein PilZ